MDGLKDETVRFRVNTEEKKQLDLVANTFGNGKKSAAVRFIVSAVAKALTETPQTLQAVQNEQ